MGSNIFFLIKNRAETIKNGYQIVILQAIAALNDANILNSLQSELQDDRDQPFAKFMFLTDNC